MSHAAASSLEPLPPLFHRTSALGLAIAVAIITHSEYPRHSLGDARVRRQSPSRGPYALSSVSLAASGRKSRAGSPTTVIIHYSRFTISLTPTSPKYVVSTYCLHGRRARNVLDCITTLLHFTYVCTFLVLFIATMMFALLAVVLPVAVICLGLLVLCSLIQTNPLWPRLTLHSSPHSSSLLPLPGRPQRV